LLVMPNSGLRIPSGVRCNLAFEPDTPVLTDSTSDTTDRPAAAARSASIDE